MHVTDERLGLAVVVLPLAMVGCSTIPDESELTRIGADELHELVIGNTTTQSTAYGRWAEYHADDETSYARAWGTWGRQDVESTHVTDRDGRMCHRYTGPYEWAGPDNEYCGMLFTDGEGKYFYKVLKDPDAPNTVGRVIEMEIKSGDPYELAE